MPLRTLLVGIRGHTQAKPAPATDQQLDHIPHQQQNSRACGGPPAHEPASAQGNARPLLLSCKSLPARELSGTRCNPTRGLGPHHNDAAHASTAQLTPCWKLAPASHVTRLCPALLPTRMVPWAGPGQASQQVANCLCVSAQPEGLHATACAEAADQGANGWGTGCGALSH